MRLQRENQLLLVTLNLLESRLLHRVFQQLTAHYRLKPSEIDPKIATAWYSTRGCVAAKMSEEETGEWLEHLHALESAGLQRLEEWTKQLSHVQLAQAHLHVQVNDAAAFVTALNDHRLMTAARHHIGQEQMDLHSPLQLVKLPLAQQEALMEIHFLAWIIEETLRALQE